METGVLGSSPSYWVRREAVNVMAFGGRLPWLGSCLCKRESICFLIFKFGTDCTCSRGRHSARSRHPRGAALLLGTASLGSLSPHLEVGAGPRPLTSAGHSRCGGPSCALRGAQWLPCPPLTSFKVSCQTLKWPDLLQEAQNIPLP